MPTASIRSEMRLAFLTEAVSRSPLPLGRTGVMKLAFFLQELRGVPLKYTFKIYTYGPYDGQVLEDLRVAESLKAINSEAFRFPGGVGVHLTSGPKADVVRKPAEELLATYEEDIEWVVTNFASRSAADLEVDSTIVYIDKSKQCTKCMEMTDIVSSVHSIKPHHSAEKISKHAHRLNEMGLLKSVR